MNEVSKKKYLAFCIAMATTFGVASVTEQFNVTPTVAQTLQDKIVEEDSFLQKINIFPVDELKGEKVLGAVAGVVGKRTDTDNDDREPQEVLALGSKDYELFPTEFDTYIKYKTVDTWAKFPNFQDRYVGYVRKAIAMARVRTGWYGTSAAAVTNKVTNPNGEDVNKGWFQLMREYDSGSQWMLQGATAGEIRIGEGGDYPNLDAAVHDCRQMLEPIFRERGDLVAFIGSDLLAADKAALYAAQGSTPSEKERLANEKVTKTYGGLPIATPSGFPSRGLFITTYDNLSWYYQDTSVRRQVVDNPKRNRVEDYTSVNDGYVVENEELAAGFEFKNIKIKEGAAWV
ncbi:phage major capsid protein, P2 family [Cellvibrio sp. QJXJ]|uniref:phage major capsid protein, P2 family n=1 Tax=Cellvibrio sp. QJXJ TaxID=2964606 RepID=UPI0021C2807B|nr:phage major capsid protein, P2 family [Cellvibrio sp. QJXJ]UUA73086.1 phage major capsid protein, P2 family [Cellvibrio sp. QJXJ]